MIDLDDDTLKHMYEILRDNHPEAALEVADLLFAETPIEYAEGLDKDDKIGSIKRIRAEYGLKLKEAKRAYEKAHEADK